MERIKQALERARQEREAAQTIAPRPKAPANGTVSTVSRRRPLEIEYTQTRVVKVSPDLMRDNRVIAGMAPDAVVDAYRMLRTRVLQRLRQNGWKSLAVTSPGIGEGKSLTAVNMAISLAREVNHTVLLVDLDLRRPGIHKFFGYQPEHGIADFLFSDIELGDIMFTPSIERLVVLPGKDRYENSSELLSMPRMLEMVEDITTRYPDRIVIFDLPPVLAVDDALAFSPFVDSFLLVIEEGETEAHALSEARELLKHVNVVGSVLNKAEDKSHYGYY